MPRPDKKELIREFIARQVQSAIDHMAADRLLQPIAGSEEAALLIRFKRDISHRVGWQVTEQYRFLELADIMEWKRTRERM